MTHESIAVIDLGGQYCHLISRRLRELGFSAQVYDYFVAPGEVKDYKGIILSGGPSSVNDDQPPRINPELLDLNIPVLGICYGHQLLAQERGATVTRGKSEFGASRIEANTSNPLFKDTPRDQTVWMSHSDSVTSVPDGFEVIASTPACDMAAFADETLKMYGVQFHPEVDHSTHGRQLLLNFARDVCGLSPHLPDASRVDKIVREIQDRVGNDAVFFLVSGGVDSMVAFALCAKALGHDRVQGLFVDTGFMRLGEADELLQNLEPLGLRDRVVVRDESSNFFDALSDERSPEGKRHIIGRLFVEIQSQAMRDLGIDEERWFLGQGTIYPDTIESGGATGRAAVIKTHHNRCAEIQQLIERGRVIEPLAELYKDEVRAVGNELGLEAGLVKRWPFPGPGLAIRALCVEEDMAERTSVAVALPAQFTEYTARSFPIWSVGVQGDARTYRRTVVVAGPPDYDTLARLSSWLCNENEEYNRVTYLMSQDPDQFFQRAFVQPGGLTRARVDHLKQADYSVRNAMVSRNLADSVWQFPVVLIPISIDGGETIVLRPVNSLNGMTATFGRLDPVVLEAMRSDLAQMERTDAVLLDITDKPPATIEWE